MEEEEKWKVDSLSEQRKSCRFKYLHVWFILNARQLLIICYRSDGHGNYIVTCVCMLISLELPLQLICKQLKVQRVHGEREKSATTDLLNGHAIFMGN